MKKIVVFSFLIISVAIFNFCIGYTRSYDLSLYFEEVECYALESEDMFSIRGLEWIESGKPELVEGNTFYQEYICSTAWFASDNCSPEGSTKKEWKTVQ